jgi:hypothetical protein
VLALLLIESFFVPTEQGRHWKSRLARLAVYLLIIAGHIWPIALDPALGFLSLLLPILGMLLLAFSVLAWYQGRQWQRLGLSSAVIITLLFSWAIVSVFPLTL